MGQSLGVDACASTPDQYEEIKCRDCLRGVLEMTGARDAVGAATRVALAEALANLVRASGVQREFQVEVTRTVDWNNPTPRSADALSFAYSVRFPDEETADVALMFLENEIEEGGRRQFLPRFVALLVAHGEVSEEDEEFEDEVWHANLRITQWTVESVWIPGKGRKAVASLEEDIQALALAVNDTVSCLQASCVADARTPVCCECEIVVPQTPGSADTRWLRHDAPRRNVGARGGSGL